MVSRIRHITFDCHDAYRLAQFWSAVTGWHVVAGNEPGDSGALVAAVLAEPPDSGMPGLLFIAVPEPKTVKNRVHLDLGPTDMTRDEEIARLAGLGARLVADHRTSDGLGWVVLTDPEGNELCIERSDKERGT